MTVTGILLVVVRPRVIGQAAIGKKFHNLVSPGVDTTRVAGWLMHVLRLRITVGLQVRYGIRFTTGGTVT